MSNLGYIPELISKYNCNLTFVKRKVKIMESNLNNVNLSFGSTYFVNKILASLNRIL